MNRFNYRLYLVIGREACRGKDLVSVATAAIRGGVDIVQIREKDLSDADFLQVAQSLSAALQEYKVPLIVNDRLAIARAIHADGIHVGNSDISPVAIKKIWPDIPLIGYSVESFSQLWSEQAEAADYLGISPVFRTPTKTDTVTEWGLEGISRIRAHSAQPLVAIGNMNRTNVQEVIRSGADCIAVVSAICGADDPFRAASEIREQIEKAL